MAPLTPGVARTRSSRGSGGGTSHNPKLIFLVRFGFPFLMLLCASWLIFALRHYKSLRMYSYNNSNPAVSMAINSNAAAASAVTEPGILAAATTSAALAAVSATGTAGGGGGATNFVLAWRLPHAFDNLLYRAREVRDQCAGLDPRGKEGAVFDNSSWIPFLQNETVATLPAFGVIQDIQDWKQSISSGKIPDWVPPHDRTNPSKWQCELPNRKYCFETQFSVVFMAYNPDRLTITLNQIKLMLMGNGWKDLVKSIVLVWNGPRDIHESESGKAFLEFQQEHSDQVSITYPLKMGYPNDLMNRYHPDVVQHNISTKAILYYDDDGPFYSLAAVNAGFELWKRHSTAQIGAMSRQIDYSPRQQAEYNKLTADGTKPNDRLFISHCDNLPPSDENDPNKGGGDTLEYNFKYFANYDANMVLPSGSFLHVNYLCFLWHPVLERVRKFVRDHPAHPDDMTVSWVVSQLAGRAPRVYSRRLKDPSESQDERRLRDLKELTTTTSTTTMDKVVPTAGDISSDIVFGTLPKQLSRTDYSNLSEEEDDLIDYERQRFLQQLQHSTTTKRQQQHNKNHHQTPPQQPRKRDLMLNINWDAGAGMTDAKRYWAALRSVSVNSLARYFGSINSGSIGWCENSDFYNPKVSGRCKPDMARTTWLPWMDKKRDEYC